MRTIMFGTAILALVATPVAAAPRPAVKAVTVKTLRSFRAADTDRSRSLSAGEFTAAGGQSTGFEALDLNDDGNVGYFELLRGVFLRLKARFTAAN